MKDKAPQHVIPVRMDGECLLVEGGDSLHGAFVIEAEAAMRFAATRIEPIEDEA